MTLNIDSLKEILPSLSYHEIFNKVISSERLNEDEGLFLLSASSKKEIFFIQKLADFKRQKTVGNIVNYSSTLYLYPTNICIYTCTFCSFRKNIYDKTAEFFSPEELLNKIYPVSKEITEVHIVGGCYQKCDLSYYTKLFSLIQKNFPHIHIKALTPIEIDYLSQLHNLPAKEILYNLKKHHLGSLPGGGAEILVDEIRQKLAPKRLNSAQFLNIHKSAHEIGIKTNISLLFGHYEKPHHIVTHLKKIRDLQDETKGFKTIVPLKFARYNNPLGKLLEKKGTPIINPYLLFSVIRLFLDNVPNIKSLWNYLGIKEAVNFLSCGANDLSSSHKGEKVCSSSTKEHIQDVSIENLCSLIKNIGRTPCLTNSQNY